MKKVNDKVAKKIHGKVFTKLEDMPLVSSGSIPLPIWILDGGTWNDEGVWVDTESWED